MFKNYTKIAFRYMKRQKGYSFINIAGLALGLACVILILFWIRDELSYDKFHTHREDIYRVICLGTDDDYFSSPAPFAPAVQEEVPEIRDAVRFREAPRFVFEYGGNAFYEADGITVDPAFFKIFSFPFIKGDPDSAFSDPLNIVITEKMARKYFGDEEPLDKSINIEGQAVLKVSGVVADVPANSHIQFDYALSHKFVEIARLCGMRWGDFNFRTYIRTTEVRNEADIIGKLNSVAAKHNCPQVVAKQVTFSLQALPDIYLNPLGNYDIPLGNKKYVFIFSIIAFFILLIACINFINLATARSEKRAREVGLRKVVGASRTQIIKQFFGESVILALISLVLALVLVQLFLPEFNDLTGKQLNFSIVNLEILFSLAAVTILVGILAGIYPSIYLSSFEPVNVMKNNLTIPTMFKYKAPRLVQRGMLRKVLVVFQFAMSIILILATVVVYDQLSYVRNSSWRLDKEYMIHIPFKENIAAKYDVVKSELLQHPDIISVAAKDCLPTTLRNNTGGIFWTGKTKDKDNVYLETTRID